MGQHLHVDFKIRLPHELKEKIRQSAESLNRTMTADIVARLEDSFKTQTINLNGQGIAPPTTEQDLQQQVQNLSEQLAEMMNINMNMYRAYYFAVESNPNIPYEQKQQLTEPKNLNLNKKTP